MPSKPTKSNAQANGSQNLKSDWRRVKFGDVVECVNDTVTDPQAAGIERVVGLDHLDPGSLHIKRWADIEEGTTFTRRFRSGQVLFGKRRAYQRKLAVAEFDGICSGDILVFEPKNDDLISELLPFIMLAERFWQHALDTSAGSLSPRTKWQDLSRYEFVIPPKDEQRRIAEILWAAENQRTSVEDSAKAAEQVVEAVVHERFQATADLRMVSLDTLSTVAYGLTVDGKRRAISSVYPYLRVANVGRGFLNLEEMRTIGCEANEISRFQLLRDDVLVVEGHADKNAIGRAAIWSDEIPICLHQNHILRARCCDELNPRYLVALMNSSEGCSYFRSRAKSTSGLHTINSTVLRKFPVPPIPRSQQDSFVEKLAAVQERMRRLQHHLSNCEALATSLRKELIEHV